MHEKTLPSQIKAYFLTLYSAFPSIGIMKFYFFRCRKFFNKITSACSFVRAYFHYSSWIYFENECIPEVSYVFKPVISRLIFGDFIEFTFNFLIFEFYFTHILYKDNVLLSFDPFASSSGRPCLRI